MTLTDIIARIACNHADALEAATRRAYDKWLWHSGQELLDEWIGLQVSARIARKTADAAIKLRDRTETGKDP
jgi:hypothetical protein